MARNFVILTCDASVEEQQALARALDGIGWWHFLPQSWVIVDGSQTHTVETIRSLVLGACPGLIHWVFEVKANSIYAAHGPFDWNDRLLEVIASAKPGSIQFGGTMAPGGLPPPSPDRNS